MNARANNRKRLEVREKLIVAPKQKVFQLSKKAP